MSTPEPKTIALVGTDTSHDPRRLEASMRYRKCLEDQVSQPDKVFITGYSFQDLDPNLIVLDDDANEHPRHWPLGKKVRATAIISGFCFLSPFASTIFAPSVHLVMQNLDITDSTIGALQVSIFLFAYAIGPLFLAPLSEKYGRAWIIHLGNFIFVAFSIGGGFARTAVEFSVCRFIAGLGGSSAVSVVGGFVSDIWDLAARPKASGIIMLGPVLGPIVGPVCGGWMSERVSWRWTLWIPAIASGLLSIIGIIYLPESYALKVLQNKIRKARKARPSDREVLYTVLDLSPRRNGIHALLSEFFRPIIYLILDPALLLASICYSVVFGVIYLIIVTYADVFGTGYGHSVGIVGTDFIAIGIGMIFGTFGTIKIMEAVFKKDVASGQPKYKPESRLISCIFGGAFIVGGLFMYGFSALRAHSIVPLIAATIFSIGAMNVMLAVQLYAVDGFKFPASAFAAISFLRCLFAGAFPLFGHKLFKRLGIDWGVGLLAFLVLGIGVPLVILLYTFGAQLRKIGCQRIEKFEDSTDRNT